MADNQLMSQHIYMFWWRIRMARKEGQVRSDSFAQKLTLPDRRSWIWKKGRQRPSVYLIWLMAQILKVDINDLIHIDDKEQIDWAEKLKENGELEDEEWRR